MAKKNEKPRYFDKAYTLKTGGETRSLYKDWAAVYDTETMAENDYAQPRRCAEALAKVLPGKSTRIIDIGCGTGLSGQALKQAGYAAIDGCDFSPDMLAKAREKAVYARLFEADLNNPPLDAETASYDAATAVGVFSFGHVSPDAIDEILRLIKPGAPLVIGLNDHFYDEGTLEAKLRALEAGGAIRVLSREHGEHLPGQGVEGWVIVADKV